MYCNGIDSLLTLFDAVEKFAVQDQIRVESFPCLWTSVVGEYQVLILLFFVQLLIFTSVPLLKYYISFIFLFLEKLPNPVSSGPCLIKVIHFVDYWMASKRPISI